MHFYADLDQTLRVNRSHVYDLEQKVRVNHDLSWIFYFLYDGGFFFLDFVRSRRSNQSHKLDLLWREFLPKARTMTANKVNYAFMAIMQVYYGSAMHPTVHALYHALRTLPTGSKTSMPGSNVGVDWFPEDLNLFIKSNVTDSISKALINSKISEYNFLSTVDRGLMSAIHSHRKDRYATLKQMDADVQVNVRAEILKCLFCLFLCERELCVALTDLY